MINDKHKISKIINALKKIIVGQDNTINLVVSSLYANQKIIRTDNNTFISSQKLTLLIDGSSGTGKTTIISEAANQFGLPFVEFSCYSNMFRKINNNINNILLDILKKSNGNINLAEKGIVCFDNFEELGGIRIGIDLVKQRIIEAELLKFINGNKYNIEYEGNTIEFDTSKLTIIATGNFYDIKRAKKIVSIKSQFMNDKVININFDQSINDYKITMSDYIKFGYDLNLIEKFNLLLSTNTYRVDDYKNILLGSNTSPLKILIKSFGELGITDITYDNEFIDIVARMAYDLRIGATGLYYIINDLKLYLLTEFINNKIKKIELTSDIFNKFEMRRIKK